MRALILVDIQNDFCPGGSLAVPNGDEVVPVANSIRSEFEFVVASQDWHPRDHLSFADNHEGKSPGDKIELEGLEQILWPVHCVQGTKGAEFHPELEIRPTDQILRKATDPKIDSYSAFFDNGRKKSTHLHELLQEKGVKEIVVLGLATDYCVKYTALDGRDLGYEVILVKDGCRGIDKNPGDVERSLQEMADKGVGFIESRVLKAS